MKNIRNQCRNCEHLAFVNRTHAVYCEQHHTMNKLVKDCTDFVAGYRLCSRCWQWKHPAEFYHDASIEGGLSIYCSECHTKRRIGRKK
jgi:hypothetical protein